MSHPDDRLSGLVDGELDHATRERVLSHLLTCSGCQLEVQALRALKSRLSWAGAETPLPTAELTNRLLHFAVPGVEPTERPRLGSSRPVSVRSAARAAAAVRPRSAPRMRRRTVGGLVALGLSAAFVLGGQSGPTSARTPIDPGTDQFVSDYVDATLEVPLTQPVDASVVGTAR